MRKYDSSVRYSENPFVEDMVIPTKTKNVRLSRIGKEENVVVNQSTGEISGTHLTTYREVDSDQFIKLFSANIAMTLDIGNAGLKALNVLVWAVQQRALGKDQVDLDCVAVEEFLSLQEKKVSISMSTFKRGITKLEEAKIIAKTLRKGRYFINPNFVFNGDRLAFTTIIERKKEKKENIKKNKSSIEEEEQLEMFDEPR